ncbi:MAG: BatD family protein [Bacteroidota bacterium]|nr:BatD family protein [Bacteroidota bacterium]
MKRWITFLFLILASADFLAAQKLIAKTSHTQIAVGEAFQISFTLNSQGSEFKPPSFNDFTVYSGPNQSSNMVYSNGQMTTSFTLSYILSPKREGKFTIGPASVNVSGGTIQSNSLSIDVIKGAGGNQGNSQQQNPSASAENISDNIFVRSNVSKTKVYQGEQITVTHKVYTRFQLRGFQDIKFPDYTGFWSQDAPSNNQQIQLTNESIDGVNFQVAELKRSYLFPQRSGKLDIEPMLVECVVRKKSSKKPRDLYEQLFGGGYEDVVYAVKSKPVSIEVSPLPQEGKPKDFSGGVGNYSFKAEISKNNVKANEAINLVITLSGKGNIKLVDPLKINFPEDFETYDPKMTDKISSAGGVNGTKTFDYVIIPRHEGDYTINGIRFSYFDPEKKEYISIPSPEFLIHVDKGDVNSAATVYTPGKKDEVKVLGKDIRYIKTDDVEWKKTNTSFFGSLLFYTGLGTPLLAFLAFILVRKKQKELNKDQIAVKSRKATKMAKKRLLAADKFLHTENKEQFYVEILKALFGYIGDKMNIAQGDLNRDYISESLQKKGALPETISQLNSAIDNCEYARYAPGAVSGDLQSIYNNTVELITKLENEIR